jgi:exopolyphosphatase/guanosine-5'-triphosphate,3'-diphosphate pyrophosphatase
LNTTYYAVLDIGSNSFHLIIAHIENNKVIVDLRDRVVLRLGEFTGTHQRQISPQNIADAIAIVNRHKEIASHYNCQILATATSAVRESANKESFLSAVFDATGIKIRVLSGDEEAKLIYTGVLGLVPADNSRNFVLDIGGGSSEIVLGTGCTPQKAISLRMGAVRCSSLFFPEFKLTDDTVINCKAYIEEQLAGVTNDLIEFKPASFYGTSGTIRIITSILTDKGLIKYLDNGLPFFTNEEFQTLKKEIFFMPSDKLLNTYTIEETRADILPAGLLILESVMDLFSIPRMQFSDYSLREGVLIEHLQSTSY